MSVLHCMITFKIHESNYVINENLFIFVYTNLVVVSDVMF